MGGMSASRCNLPRRHTRVLAALCGVLIVLGLHACSDPSPPPPAASGSDTRHRPHRLFSEASFWYQKLPDDAPVAADSGEIMARIRATLPASSRGEPRPGINTHAYTPPLIIARNSDPVVTFRWENCGGLPNDGGLVEHHLTDLHVPADAMPAAGTDGEMTVYNVDTGQYTDTWQTRRDAAGWSACWGGTIEDAGSNDGVFPAPFGTAGSGLALEPGTVKATELSKGYIDHVVGVTLPVGVIDGYVSAPATRTDGNATGPATISEGQLLRLPPDLDLDALQLSPVARTFARAAQEYGLVVWDRSDDVTFRAENARGLATDPYPDILRGQDSVSALRGDPARGESPFPFDRLQVLQRDYVPAG